MKPEQALWHRRLRPALVAIPGLAFDRIESTVSLGIPDVAFTYRGHGWIENKVSTTNCRIDLSGWRRTQRAWCLRHRPGRVFICLGTPAAVYMVSTAGIEHERSIPLTHPNILGAWPKTIDPRELADILTADSPHGMIRL